MSSWNLLGDTGTENIVEAESVKIKGDGVGVSVAVADNGGVAEATISLASTAPTQITAGANVQRSPVSGGGNITISATNVLSNASQVSSQATITDVISLTATEYGNLAIIDPNTLYIVI
jgi:hypothetical protein